MPRSLRLLLLAYVAIGCLYSIATPPFEASDELHHYPVVRHIAAGHGLPVQVVGEQSPWAQEGSQPPAYYLIAAGLTFWIDTEDFESVHTLNPFARAGIPGTTHNANYTIAPAALRASTFPPQGTFLAIYVIRLASLVMGACTVLLTYYLAIMLIEPAEERSGRAAAAPLLAAGLVAFNPMFLFISASVNNDNLIWLLATAILCLLVRGIRHHALPAATCVALGILLGLAALTKISGLVLAPVVGLALLAVGPSPAQGTSSRGGVLEVMRISAGRAVQVFVPAALVAGWWYARNLALYGELLGLERMALIAGPRPPGFGLAHLAQEWRSFWYAYWGLFGSFSILAPAWMYALFTGLTLAAIAGLVAVVWRALSRDAAWRPNSKARDAWRHIIVLVFVGLTYVSLVRWALITPASQGRLVFTTLAPVSAYLALGLCAWLPGRAMALLVSFLAGVALAVGLSIRPHYVPQPAITLAQLPPDLNPIHARLAPGVDLIGYRLLPRTRPGQLSLTLYWRAAESIDDNHNLFLHVLGRDRTLVGSIDTWPGGGLRPTSYWTPGEIYPDTYHVELSEVAVAPTTLLIDVAMWSGDSSQPFSITLAGGESIPTILLDAGVLQPSQPTAPSPAYPAGSTLEFGIHLLGYDMPARLRAGQPAELTLYWQATEPVPGDFTVFVHLVDAAAVVVAQADGPPAAGYWPTSLWQPGYALADTHVFNVGWAGTYRLLVGLYDPETVVPLVAFRPDGSEWADRAIELATVTVE